MVTGGGWIAFDATCGENMRDRARDLLAEHMTDKMIGVFEQLRNPIRDRGPADGKD